MSTDLSILDIPYVQNHITRGLLSLRFFAGRTVTYPPCALRTSSSFFLQFFYQVITVQLQESKQYGISLRAEQDSEMKVQHSDSAGR